MNYFGTPWLYIVIISSEENVYVVKYGKMAKGDQ
jgi:hypothetical protein